VNKAGTPPPRTTSTIGADAMRKIRLLFVALVIVCFLFATFDYSLWQRAASAGFLLYFILLFIEAL
jgi:hypothetical protein